MADRLCTIDPTIDLHNFHPFPSFAMPMDFTLSIERLQRADLDTVYALLPDEPEMQGAVLWHFFTPYAHVLKATMDGEFAGYICAIVHGDTGWIRELFVNPLWMDLGVGKALTTAMVEWMEGQGTTGQLLIAREDTEGFWEKFGFENDGALLRYEDGLFINASKDEVTNMEPEHMMAVLHMDRQASGEDRGELLREHSYLGSVYVEGSRVRGFSLPLLGHGLIVADSPEVGLELQRWLLPIQPYVILPVGHLAAHAHMIQRKYVAEPAGTRMVRGERPAFKLQMFYAHP